MTPQERISQLAAERGGVPSFPRPAPPAPDVPQNPRGFDVALSLSWRRITDTWNNQGHIAHLQRLEVYLAAGVICRYLGPDWRREENPDARGGQCRIVHREGWGVRFGRCWQDSGGFSASAIHQYKRNEPPSITVSATRPLGAIAADIQRRLINNGLREAWEQEQSAARGRKNGTRATFDKLRAVCKAWDGHIRQRNNEPCAEIPGGIAKEYYDGRVQIELCVTTDEAVALAPRKAN